MAQLLLKLPISVLLFLSLSTSSLAITLTKEGCVDPTGFATCKSAATSVAATCLAKNCAGEGQCTDENNCDSTDANCVTSCVCAAYEAWINCALESCWNKVYTCEYMNLLVNAARYCPTAGVGVDLPYFAPNGSTPDSCSCDIYYVYSRHRSSSDYAPECWSEFGDNTAAHNECYCCADSESLSTFYNTCPTTDPASLPFFPGLLVPSLSELQSSTCQSVFAAKVDCLALNYSVPGVSGSQFFSAADLPTNGTAAISDLPGSITSPPGGETMTWQFQSGNVVTVTAAPYTGIAAVASTSTAAGSESSVTTSESTTMSTGTEASTGSAATSSATKASFAVPSSPRVGQLLGEMLVLALGFCVL